jgi:hypothetical protein
VWSTKFAGFFNTELWKQQVFGGIGDLVLNPLASNTWKAVSLPGCWVGPSGEFEFMSPSSSRRRRRG